MDFDQSYGHVAYASDKELPRVHASMVDPVQHPCYIAGETTGLIAAWIATGAGLASGLARVR